jgi:hypothetical protein
MTNNSQTKKNTQRRLKKKAPPATGVDRDLQAKIGAQLRSMHDDVIREGVPDRFRALLERLDQSKSKG